MDTIFALSSGVPPAAIAVVRISGTEAFAALSSLLGGGAIPAPRVASLRSLRDPTSNAPLDRALVLTFPAPATATGEDLVELHLHGGRAVVRAVEAALGSLDGLRPAEAGEFTRRALANGRIDLAQAEGLGDLLSAETELQRRAALAVAEGGLSREVDGWRRRLIAAAARIEAALDFSDEIDVDADALTLRVVRAEAQAVADEIAAALSVPRSERLRDGIRVVLAGPPNSGKSTLLNAMAGRDVAIVSPIAGTTRDRIEVPVAHRGLPFVLTDTAGLREEGADAIERIGIDRAAQAIATADIVLWLGDDAPEETGWIWLRTRMDQSGRDVPKPGQHLAVSAHNGAGMEALWALLVDRARGLIPGPRDAVLNGRQAELCAEALIALRDVVSVSDELIVADSLRRANLVLARITGDVGIEAMLDALFSRFCIGK